VISYLEILANLKTIMRKYKETYLETEMFMAETEGTVYMRDR